MRKIFAIIFILAATKSYAQDNSTGSYHLGIQLTAEDPMYPVVYFQDLNKLFSFQVSYSNNKHQFDLGFMFAPLRRPQYEQKLGMRLGYTFYPNGRSQLFSSYLRFSVPFHFVKDTPVTYVPFQITNIDNAIAHEYWSVHVQGGYGLQLNLSDGFYLGSDISLLFGSYFTRFEYIDLQNNSNKLLSRWGLSLYPQIALNLGYRF